MQSVHTSNTIDLTLDDDDDHYPTPPTTHDQRLAKRPRIDAPQTPGPSSYQPQYAPVQALPVVPPLVSPSPFAPYPGPYHPQQAPSPFPYLPQHSYRPPFAGHPSFYQQHRPPHPASPPPSRTPSAASTSLSAPGPPHPAPQSQVKHVIDLTGTPSPPPNLLAQMQAKVRATLPAELPPKTAVCIGQLSVNALILYPVRYLTPTNPLEIEWVWARIQYQKDGQRLGPGRETIELRTPTFRGSLGELIPAETFGVIEQKAAEHIGPMLAKGLIKLDAKVRRTGANLPILPLRLLVHTPKGNVAAVGHFLKTAQLLLDHPSPDFESDKTAINYYCNPHDPPPGGFNQQLPSYRPPPTNPWTSSYAPAGKTVEFQRAQAEELFKSKKSESTEELPQTDPAPEVATKLYPHQKKALTFLLDREREVAYSPDGKFRSLWAQRQSSFTKGYSWYNIITQREEFEEPPESKGAILADDMGLGKTITCVALIAATLASASAFAATPLDPVALPPPRQDAPDGSHSAGANWNMPEGTMSVTAANKAKAKAEREQDKLEADYVRNNRLKAKSRATLIVCPLSTVANWEDQFREHWSGDVSVVGGHAACSNSSASQSSQASSSASTSSCSDSNGMQVDSAVKVEEHASPIRPRKGAPLRIYIYHGNARRPDPAFLADFDAVITTYATLASEWSKQNKSLQEDDEDDGDSEDLATETDDFGNQVVRLPKPKKKGNKRKKINLLAQATGVEQPSALQSVHWFRVVLDEAHSIKETTTVASRACCDLIADRRLCLTGTPVQNKLDDVFALIKFLRIKPFDDKNTWTEWIGNPVKFGQDNGFIRLQIMMQCITLRRTKDSKADGKPILQLPQRQEVTRRLQFTPEELEVYGRFFSESKKEFQHLSKNNEVMKNYVGILQQILRLRQICDHYDLVKDKHPDDSGSGDQLSYKALTDAIEKEGLTPARASGIFTILREAVAPQCFQCGCDFCASDSPNELDDEPGPSTIPAKRGRKPKASTSGTGANPASGPRPILTRCQHLFCYECFFTCIFPSWPNVEPETMKPCPACQATLSPADAIEVKHDATPGDAGPSKKKNVQKRERRQKTTPSDSFRSSTKINALVADLLATSRLNAYSANYSGIQEVDKEGEPDIMKTVVFSQWTSMLDKVEDALDNARIRYERLDGTMKREERARAMDALKNDPGCEVLLVSLRAGGVGLNLTAAQRVYLLDPYWNPAVENQALDRVHRLGQTKPVIAIKYIMENSIEDRLLDIQKRKIDLANRTVNRPQTKSELLERRLRDLEVMFTGDSKTTRPPTQVLSMTNGLFNSSQPQPQEQHQPEDPPAQSSQSSQIQFHPHQHPSLPVQHAPHSPRV